MERWREGERESERVREREGVVPFFVRLQRGVAKRSVAAGVEGQQEAASIVEQELVLLVQRQSTAREKDGGQS